MTEIRVWEDSETIATYALRMNSYGEILWWDATYTGSEIDEEQGLTLTELRKCYTLIDEELED